jgi:hypothetical protein
MKRIIVLPFAELDIKDSVEYYRQIKDDLKFQRIFEVLDGVFQ